MAGPREPDYEDWPTEERRAAEAETRVMRRRPTPPPPWWRENWWIWLAVLAVAVVAGLLALFVLQDDDEEGATTTAALVTVPDVVGLREDEAVARLDEARLRAEIERATSPVAPRGSVIDQDPAAGSEVARGRTVLLTVSSGPEEVETVTQTVTETETTPRQEPETVQVPDVVGLPHAEAGATVEELGLVADTYPVPSDEFIGLVVSLRPEPGTEVRKGTIVRLDVSLGTAERDPVTVPDVTGLPARDARSSCREAGLTCRTVYRTAPSEEEKGEVLDQRPAAGETVPLLTQVTLFVGR